MADEEEFTIITRDTPPQFLVMIESFSMLSKHGIWKYDSRIFEAGGYNWRLIIYPNGHESNEEGEYVGAYLSMVGTCSGPVEWEVNANFSILLFNQKLYNYLCFQGKPRCFSEVNSKWGFMKMVSKEFLMDGSNGYLVDDACMIGAEVIVDRTHPVIEYASVLEDTCPFMHAWKISQVSKLSGVWSSEKFYAGSHTWKVKLFPNCTSFSIQIVCVCAKSFAPHQRLKADIRVIIKNQLHHADRSHNFSPWFTSTQTDWRLPDFISFADMRNPRKGFVVDNCLFLGVEIAKQVVSCDLSYLD